MAGKYLKKKRKNPLVGCVLWLMLVLFAAAITLSIWKITERRNEEQAGTDAYASLANSAVTVTAPDPEQVTTTVVEAGQEEEIVIDVTSASMSVDFDALQAINPQVVAWISSDNGAIHYPVVQGTDNDYYLNHMVDGTVNRSGSIFMDFRNASDLTDRNTFIYGHNMRNGAMFATLERYAQPGYYEQHPELLLVTSNGSYSLQVFAGCVVPGNSDVYQLSYRDDADFAAYLEKVRTMSAFSSPVEVGMQDRLVTLSTCAYDYEDARFVLFCKPVPMQ